MAVLVNDDLVNRGPWFAELTAVGVGAVLGSLALYRTANPGRGGVQLLRVGAALAGNRDARGAGGVSHPHEWRLPSGLGRFFRTRPNSCCYMSGSAPRVGPSASHLTFGAESPIL